MIGWDVLALGLPAAGEAFDAGVFTQHLEWPGRWLERGRIVAADTRLLDGPLGWAGQCVLATAWFATGAPLATSRREQLLEAARECVLASPLAARAGATCLHDNVVVLRVLADRVEQAVTLLAGVRAAWRQAVWSLAAEPPRVWRT
jgi:urease accessory protein